MDDDRRDYQPAVHPSTLRRIIDLLDILNRKVDHLMSDQSHLDSDVAALVAEVATLNTTDQAIAAEIAALKATNPAVDFTALDAVTADLTASVTSLAALVPTPAPTGDPAAT